MIKFITINILEWLNSIIALEKVHYQSLKNILTVSEDLLRIIWKCMMRLNEILILVFVPLYCKTSKPKSIANNCRSNLDLHPNKYFQILNVLFEGRSLMTIVSRFIQITEVPIRSKTFQFQ